MLHSLPALLSDLERRLTQGEDPVPLLASVSWNQVIDWPRNLDEAQALKRQLSGLQMLIQGLQAPIRATLMALNPQATYSAQGMDPMPNLVPMHLHERI